MKIFLSILNFLALVGAIIWWNTSPDWEPAVTSIGLFGTLLAQIFTSDEIKSKLKLKQKSGKDSYNYQALGNQTVNDSKIIQNGNQNAQVLQAEKMTVHIGIDEKRAREIYQEMNLQLRKDYTQEAWTVANSRIREFENKLMPNIEKVNGALEAFADPSFQLLLVEAQKTAAATERPADYDLLSELLIHRFTKGENRTIRAGISRAVEIVDKIADDALLGLTVSHAISTFFPTSGDIHQGLDALNDLFGKLFNGSLPTGSEWLDHLDILDTVRLVTYGNLKKIEEYYPQELSGYIDLGIEKESENHQKAKKILTESKLPQTILVEHHFNKNFIRIFVRYKNEISNIKLTNIVHQDGKTYSVPVEITENQKQSIYSIYDLYKQDDNLRKENVKKFMEEWEKRPNLKTLKGWWDNLDTSFQITSVGKVLAHANAQRCDKNLPPLN